jgi:hypothetical protein
MVVLEVILSLEGVADILSTDFDGDIVSVKIGNRTLCAKPLSD